MPMTMSSYELIKAYFTKNERPGSVGYLLQLNRAIDLFIRLDIHLKDREQAVRDMNDDREATEALAQRSALQKAGLL